MTRGQLRELQVAFHAEAMKRPYPTQILGGQSACLLAVRDPLKRLCKGKWEAFHFIGRQAIRKSYALWGADPDLIALAEWDPRNGGPGCVEHHRRFDSHADAGPDSAIEIPAFLLPADVQEFIANWGLDAEAERRFSPC